jgi:hypothetical protein
MPITEEIRKAILRRSMEFFQVSLTADDRRGTLAAPRRSHRNA